MLKRGDKLGEKGKVRKMKETRKREAFQRRQERKGK